MVVFLIQPVQFSVLFLLPLITLLNERICLSFQVVSDLLEHTIFLLNLGLEPVYLVVETSLNLVKASSLAVFLAIIFVLLVVRQQFGICSRVVQVRLQFRDLSFILLLAVLSCVVEFRVLLLSFANLGHQFLLLVTKLFQLTLLLTL